MSCLRIAALGLRLYIGFYTSIGASLIAVDAVGLNITMPADKDSFMAKQAYSGYTAKIFEADDGPSAAAKGENMKAQFPGADYELVKGDPCGTCSHVEGGDAKIRERIKNWINS